uniref:Uncharacterized protein n=1 Tax=Setaria digitata TaxID=48799 RepID=A0A915PP65_9BILA
MASMRHIESAATFCFALCTGLYILATCVNGQIAGNARAWYEVMLRSRPQFRLERDSRSYGKPTFIRFGKRGLRTYNPILVKNK